MSVYPFSPTWPQVRCTRCAEIYTPKPVGSMIVGQCPRCGCDTFNTSAPVPEGFTIEQQQGEA